MTNEQAQKCLSFFFSWLPVWMFRYFQHGHKNKVSGRRNFKIFAAICTLGSLVVYAIVAIFISVVTRSDGFSAHPFISFWIAFVLLNLIANALARHTFKWAPQDFSVMMYSDRHIPFSEASDARGREFPIGWNQEKRWMYYGLRPTHEQSEYFYPEHLILCGQYGRGQFEFVMRTILQAMETVRNLVVIVLDDLNAGLNFRELPQINCLTVLSDTKSIMQAVHLIGGHAKNGGIIDQRVRHYIQGDKTEILLVMDYPITMAMVGKEPRFKKVASCFDRIIRNGKANGVHVLALAPAEMFDGKIEISIRNWFNFIQFATENRVTIRYNDQVSTQKIDSPKAFDDLFFYEANGTKYECKQTVVPRRQFLNRIRDLSRPEFTEKTFSARHAFLWPPFTKNIYKGRTRDAIEMWHAFNYMPELPQTIEPEGFYRPLGSDQNVIIGAENKGTANEPAAM